MPARRSFREAFTLVELLVVIAIIGVLIALLLPAVQAAREAARRTECGQNLSQLGLAVLNYEMAFRSYPAGTMAKKGPIKSQANTGYHHSWITHILPYMEQNNTYRNIDRGQSVYHPKNIRVRALAVPLLSCASSPAYTQGYTSYAAVHHNVEAPIDVNNNGVFFLNSRVRHQDIADGSSQTLFLGEKITLNGDLGWMAGTRSSLRNTGAAPLGGAWGAATPWGPGGPQYASRPLIDNATMEAVLQGDAEAAGPVQDPPVQAPNPPANAPANANQPPPKGPLYVGGFGSFHPGGSMFVMGDGAVRFVPSTISLSTYQQLGHRADGKLLDSEDY